MCIANSRKPVKTRKAPGLSGLGGEGVWLGLAGGAVGLIMDSLLLALASWMNPNVKSGRLLTVGDFTAVITLRKGIDRVIGDIYELFSRSMNNSSRSLVDLLGFS